MSIFLCPETTFAIDITETKDATGRTVYDVVDGGPYVLRTMTGRQCAKIEQSQGKADACYDMLPALLVSGLDRMQIERLDPAVAMIFVLESHRRSHVTEADRGK
jgi:hypothetical protein